jgi:putative SOS response-associated peptidase YedK
MCNLYSMTRNQDAIRRLFKVTKDSAGNMPSFPAIFPDSEAPVIHAASGERELTMMRWGFPPPPKGNQLVTNVRNVSSPFWRAWIKPEFRCLVPATSFSEYAPEPNPATGKKDIVWFSLDASRPLFAFAGLWRPWTGARGNKSKPIEGDHLLYSFLTTEPNAVVKPIHAKAMPVILREDEWETWLTAPVAHALHLQSPLPNAALQIVARGPEKQDSADMDQPPPEQDYGGGDIASLQAEPSTDDDRPLD